MDPSSIGGPTLMDIDEPVKTINGVNAFIDAFNA